MHLAQRNVSSTVQKPMPPGFGTISTRFAPDCVLVENDDEIDNNVEKSQSNAKNCGPCTTSRNRRIRGKITKGQRKQPVVTSDPLTCRGENNGLPDLEARQNDQ